MSSAKVRSLGKLVNRYNQLGRLLPAHGIVTMSDATNAKMILTEMNKTMREIDALLAATRVPGL